MMRTISNSVVLACALILTLPVARMALAAGAEAGVSHTVVAASGTAAPAGGHYGIFTHVTVNARGQIAFDAAPGGPGTSGVFVVDGRRTSAIALGGDPDPAAANSAFVDNSFFTADGDVVFDANFTDARREEKLPPIERGPDYCGVILPVTLLHALDVTV
jgi:hypothetical protein